MTGPGFNARRFGSVFHNDGSNLYFGNARDGCTAAEYKTCVADLLKLARPGVLAQGAAHPDPVLYRSKVATYWTKYLVDVCRALQPDFSKPDEAQRICDMLNGFVEEGTDLLQLTIEACREAHVPIVEIYPTMFSCPMWLYPAHGHHRPPGGTHEPPIGPTDRTRLLRYKKELCEAALKLYADGADGIGTFNWFGHHQPGVVKDPDRMGKMLGLGGKKRMMHVCSMLGDRRALEEYYRSDAALPE